MISRAQFLRRMLAGAGALVVGDEALEAFERLTHQRRFFPSVVLSPKSPDVWADPRFIGEMIFDLNSPQIEAFRRAHRSGDILLYSSGHVRNARIRVTGIRESVSEFSGSSIARITIASC
jgi:hypothetical protein